MNGGINVLFVSTVLMTYCFLPVGGLLEAGQVVQEVEPHPEGADLQILDVQLLQLGHLVHLPSISKAVKTNILPPRETEKMLCILGGETLLPIWIRFHLALAGSGSSYQKAKIDRTFKHSP